MSLITPNSSLLVLLGATLVYLDDDVGAEVFFVDRVLVKPQDYILVECPFSASWNIDRSSFGAPAQFRWGGDTSVKVVFHPFATVPVRSYMMIGFESAVRIFT